MSKIELMEGDCLDLMGEIPDQSIDMVLTDPPYGTTTCKWDCVIDLDKMWAHLHRITKPHSAMVFTCVQPYTSKLILSNLEYFKYSLVWQKK